MGQLLDLPFLPDFGKLEVHALLYVRKSLVMRKVRPTYQYLQSMLVIFAARFLQYIVSSPNRV